MAFSQEAVRTPTSIGDVTIVLKDDGTAQSARFVVVVKDQLGAEMRALSGDLVPHLTAGQISTIQAFLAAMRAKAVDEILP